MPASTPRTRLIFANCNVFVGPAGSSGNTATGQMYHYIGLGFTGYANSGSNMIAELRNVTSANMSCSFNRQDLNVLGRLQRVGQILMDAADISLDVSWNATEGFNESCLGFNARGESFLSGILTKRSDSKNYFVSVSQQGVDDDGEANPHARDVYGFGNAFISNYSFEASVGSIATSSISVNALNLVGYTGSSGALTPAVDPTTSIRNSLWTFQLPIGGATGNNDVFALKPGDVSVEFPTNAGFLAPMSGTNAIVVQSFSLSVPMGRTTLNKLGAPFGYSRELQPPINCSLSVRALATEVNQNAVDELYCDDRSYDMLMRLRQPSCNGTGLMAMILGFNDAKLTSWSQGVTVGGDSTVDLNFSAQIAGSTSTDGITVSGFGAFSV